MPLYAYTCPDCGDREEHIRSCERRDDPVLCDCGTDMKRDVAVNISAHFRGTGFYETDYRKKN